MKPQISKVTMSSYGERVQELCRLVCNDRNKKPQQTGNPLAEDLSQMAEKLTNALKSNRQICQDLERFSSNQLPNRLSNPTLKVGQNNARLLVSLKQQGDSVLNSTKEDPIGFNQENLEINIATAEDNFSKATNYLHTVKRINYQLERLHRSIQKAQNHSETLMESNDCSNGFGLDASTSSAL